MPRRCCSLGAGSPWSRFAVSLLLLAGLGACSPASPPLPGGPGINLSTPLPYTPVALPPTAGTVPTPAATRAASPAPPSPVATASPSAPAVPTVNTALPQVVMTNSVGTPARLYAEIADTPEKQETGLMNRPALPEDQGMLFVFPGETTTPFWMENTLIPLSIAFIGGDGTIVDIQDMKALDISLHTPAHPYVNALEVNVGYFARHAILVGNHVRLPALPVPPTAPPTATVLDGSP